MFRAIREIETQTILAYRTDMLQRDADTCFERADRLAEKRKMTSRDEIAAGDGGGGDCGTCHGESIGEDSVDMS